MYTQQLHSFIQKYTSFEETITALYRSNFFPYHTTLKSSAKHHHNGRMYIHFRYNRDIIATIFMYIYKPNITLLFPRSSSKSFSILSLLISWYHLCNLTIQWFGMPVWNCSLCRSYFAERVHRFLQLLRIALIILSEFIHIISVGKKNSFSNQLPPRSTKNSFSLLRSLSYLKEGKWLSPERVAIVSTPCCKVVLV